MFDSYTIPNISGGIYFFSGPLQAGETVRKLGCSEESMPENKVLGQTVGVKNAPKGSVTARLKGGCSKHILLAAANKRLLYLSKIIDDISFLIVRW